MGQAVPVHLSCTVICPFRLNIVNKRLQAFRTIPQRKHTLLGLFRPQQGVHAIVLHTAVFIHALVHDSFQSKTGLSQHPPGGHIFSIGLRVNAYNIPPGKALPAELPYRLGHNTLSPI